MDLSTNIKYFPLSFPLYSASLQVYKAYCLTFYFSLYYNCVAGVVVSCKIPILATRVRFPGDAIFFSSL